MLEEYDLEFLLQLNFKKVIHQININSDILIELDNMNEKYNKLLKEFSSFSDINLQKNIDFSLSLNSFKASTLIEDEIISDVETFNDVNKLNEYYFDHDVIEDFYYNFNTNIKKINKCVSNKYPGIFRSEIKKHVVINTTYGNLLVADYKNINKYLEQLIKLNLIKGNNTFVEAWVIHAIFEAIHPFSDGNGRVGRFILNNHLNQHSINKTYLDTTILKHKDLYYQALFNFQVKQDFEQSTIEFLQIVKENYQDNLNTLSNYINNYKLLNAIIKRDKYLSKYIEEVVSILFTNELVSKKKIYNTLKRSSKTNQKILEYLVINNYLKQVNKTLYLPCYKD